MAPYFDQNANHSRNHASSGVNISNQNSVIVGSKTSIKFNRYFSKIDRFADNIISKTKDMDQFFKRNSSQGVLKNNYLTV